MHDGYRSLRSFGLLSFLLSIGALLEPVVPSPTLSFKPPCYHVPFRGGNACSIFEDHRCIATPQEYVAAFLQRRSRCVNKNIIVRIQSDNGKGGAPRARELFEARLTARPVTFFSYSDTPAKYLRSGVPLELGDFNAKPLEGGDADATFEGLESLSSFMAMLQQIGYDTPSTFITGTYALVVGRRPPQLPLDNSFIPTWRNVVTYFSRYLAWVAGDPSFQLDRKIVKALGGRTFGNFTGCPSACTFEDLEFPGPKSPRPAQYGTRLSPTECQNPDAARFVLSEPTGFDDRDASCSQLWKDARTFANDQCTDASNITVIKAFGANLVKKLRSLSSVEEQAMYFRAYLNTGCGGSFNTLFSGNGFTYTANGGLISPTGKELLLGAAPHLNMDAGVSMVEDVQYVYFCSDGKFSRDPNFKCPTSG